MDVDGEGVGGVHFVMVEGLWAFDILILWIRM